MMTDENETGFADGLITQIVEFDYDAIDGEDRETQQQRDARIIARLFSHLLMVGGRNPHQLFIAVNALAFANHCHPSQQMSGEEIARTLGMNKAAWFKRVNQWRDVLRLPHMAGSWDKEARQSIKKATKEYHAKRKRTIRVSDDIIGRARALAGISNK